MQDKPVKKTSEGHTKADVLCKRKGIAYACKKGNKPDKPNQDDFFILVDGATVIIGVFDGHGDSGHFCSNYAQQLFPKYLLTNPNYIKDLELALKQTFVMVDEALRALSRSEHFSVLWSGTTATVLVHRDNMLYISHVGDTRSILGKLVPEKKEVTAIPLTKEHWPLDPKEKQRVEETGGEVKNIASGTPRVYYKGSGFPGLAMTRSIGDDMAKCCGIIPEPEVKCIKLESTDAFVIIGSDGVWEYMSNEDAVKTAYEYGKEKSHESVSTIVESAYNLWQDNDDTYTDDITCILYHLT